MTSWYSQRCDDGVIPASVSSPRLGSDAMTLPRSTKPGSVMPSRTSSGSHARTPLIAIRPIFIARAPAPGSPHAATIKRSHRDEEEPPERLAPRREKADQWAWTRRPSRTPPRRPAAARPGGDAQPTGRTPDSRNPCRRTRCGRGASSGGATIRIPPSSPGRGRTSPIAVPVRRPARIANQAARKFKSCIESASLAYDDEMRQSRAISEGTFWIRRTAGTSSAPPDDQTVSSTDRIVTGARFGKSERSLTSLAGKPKRSSRCSEPGTDNPAREDATTGRHHRSHA